MPPKKQTAKELAAEVKKQNTLKAQEIVSQLLLDKGKSAGDSIMKKPVTKKPEKSGASDSSKKPNLQKDVATKSKRTTNSVRNKVSTSKDSETVDIRPFAEMGADSEVAKPVKMTAAMKPEAADSGKNLQVKDVATKSKRTTSSVRNKVSTSNDSETVDIRPFAEMGANSEAAKSGKMSAAMKPVAAESGKKRSAQDENTAATYKRNKINIEDKALTLNGEVADISRFAELATSSETRQRNKSPPKNYKSRGRTSSTKESATGSSTSKAANFARPWKAHTSHGAGYQYEIDCEQVADSIDVKDLQKYLEKNLKVNGQKNNLGSTVSILCEGHKAIIKSKTFLPKKSLRFLSKKFLKRNWNIRVLSKNVHSYEYKYVGAQ